MVKIKCFNCGKEHDTDTWLRKNEKNEYSLDKKHIGKMIPICPFCGYGMAIRMVFVRQYEQLKRMAIKMLKDGVYSI